MVKRERDEIESTHRAVTVTACYSDAKNVELIAVFSLYIDAY